MEINAANAELREIPVELIDRNPENPRMVFRPGEMETLIESVRRYGIQVPVSLYRRGRRYILIDGERRWRCAIKLNKKTIPALVQAEPTQLTNLLLMFNIHALREQWDLLTVALKLPKVIELITREGKTPTERELADRTGLRRATIRRCRLLMDLPDQYKDQLLDELKKPEAQQKLTEDFFIEMERSLTTVERALPDLIPNKNKVRNVLIAKYRNGTIDNLVDLRKVAKIARAENVDADRQAATQALTQLFSPNEYGVDEAFHDSVSEAYSERDLLTRIRSLAGLLDELRADQLDEHVRQALRDLCKKVSNLLRP